MPCIINEYITYTTQRVGISEAATVVESLANSCRHPVLCRATLYVESYTIEENSRADVEVDM